MSEIKMDKKITKEDYIKVFKKLKDENKISKEILQWCNKIDEAKKEGQKQYDYFEWQQMLETEIKLAIMNKKITYKEAYIIGDLYGVYGEWQNCYVREEQK